MISKDKDYFNINKCFFIVFFTYIFIENETKRVYLSVNLLENDGIIYGFQTKINYTYNMK